MNIFLAGFVSFLFGVLAHIFYDIINNSRKKDRVKKTLLGEIKTNYFQIRDHLRWASDQRQKLKKMDGVVASDGKRLRSGESIIIGNYKFSLTAYNNNVSHIHLLGSETETRIHHYYSRLRTLESIASDALKLFQNAEEIQHSDEKYQDVKAINSSKLSAMFRHTLKEYEFFEKQAYGIGTDLLSKLQ